MFLQPLLLWKRKRFYPFWLCICNLWFPASNAHAPYYHLWTAELSLADRRKDEQTDKMMLIFAFINFANVPQNGNILNIVQRAHVGSVTVYIVVWVLILQQKKVIPEWSEYAKVFSENCCSHLYSVCCLCNRCLQNIVTDLANHAALHSCKQRFIATTVRIPNVAQQRFSWIACNGIQYTDDRSLKGRKQKQTLTVRTGFERILEELRTITGHAVAQLVEALRYKLEDRGFDSRWCHWKFSLTWSFRPHYGPGVDSASNRNE